MIRKSEQTVFYVLISFLFIAVAPPKDDSGINSDAGPKKTTYWRINSSSSLKISGSTNVNQFECSLESPEISDTLSFTPNYENTSLVFNLRKVGIDVRGFECDHSLITQDFRKTLKADAYPFINLLFLNIDISPELSPESVPGRIQLDLAGISNQYLIDYAISEPDPEHWVLKGSKKISLDDFNLEPPSHFLNLIKVNDSITIFFNLQLQLLDM